MPHAMDHLTTNCMFGPQDKLDTYYCTALANDFLLCGHGQGLREGPWPCQSGQMGVR